VNKITQKFAELKSANKKAFITYVMASDPSFEQSEKIVNTIANSGADILEIGMPFSDPAAEGVTIQKAAIRALNANGSIKNTFQLVENFRKQNQSTAIILMGYLNPILNYGIENFINKSKSLGVDGFIIVDLPPEEEAEFTKFSIPSGLSLIRLLTPTTTKERAKKILQNSSGFAYYVSVTGVTGQKTAVKDDVAKHIKELKTITDLPICVGFGIKTPQAAKDFASVSDGIIVGSAIIDLVDSNQNNSDYMLDRIKNFVSEISNAVKN
jgi:tryptophan synthase alpha chain